MSRVGEYCYGVDQEQLEEIIVNLLKEKVNTGYWILYGRIDSKGKCAW